MAASKTLALLCLLSPLATPPALEAQLTPFERAELVLRLLPEGARADATVLLRGPNRTETTYRQGSGRFLCVSDATDPATLSMVCHHRVLEDRLHLEREVSRESGLTGQAFRTRLCQEVARRKMSVPDGAMEITASLPIAPDGTHPPEMTVYHLLWLPFASAASTGVADVDPEDGGPFLHQAGSCGAHLMWSQQVQARRP